MLEVKNHDHLAYLCNMAYLMGQMSRAKSIQGDEAIDRLIYLRIVSFLALLFCPYLTMK